MAAKSKRRAPGTGAAATKVTATGDGRYLSATSHAPQAPRAFAFQVKATGSTPQTTSYSVTNDGARVGFVTRHADGRNVCWLARNAQKQILGCYATQDAALARLAKAVRP